MRLIQLIRMIMGSLGLVIVLLLSLQITTPQASAATEEFYSIPNREPTSEQSRQDTIPTPIVFTPTKDNTLYQNDNGNVSNGAGNFFFVGNTNDGSTRRGLASFAVANKIPAGATILSATLQLQMSKSKVGTANVALHRALADWGEGTSDADGAEGTGAAATTGDATWLHTFYNTTLWQSPGGDFVLTATATISVSEVGKYTWPSTPALVADVQQWLDNSSSDFGWVLVGDESANATAKRFVAREATVVADHPQLSIMYAVTDTMTNTLSSLIYLPLLQR